MPLSKSSVFALCIALALPMSGNAFTVSSETPDFLVSGAEAVTGNPAGIQPRNECYPASDDHSAPGEILSDGDWVVTNEVSFQDFQLVSFAAIATPKGEGGCEFFDGKVAVWRDGAFVALIEEGVADRFQIGFILPSDGSSVVIRSGAEAPETTGFIHYDAATEELFVSLRP